MAESVNPVLAYWYFHLPNYVLAVLMYTLVGRFLLGFFVPANWDNYIWRTFVRLTDWFITGVRFITPRMVPLPLLLLFSIIWILFARFLFFIVMLRLDLAPRVAWLADFAGGLA